MDRAELKSKGVAARGYGTALFLDESDDVEPDAVVFTPHAGAWTVFATDGAAAVIETTRRSFTTDAEAFDYMHQCLREQIAARRAERVAQTQAEGAKPLPSLLSMYRKMDPTGVLTVLASIATTWGWLWISPLTYTREDEFKLYSGERGSYIFDADTGVWVVAACYGLAALNMSEQWSLGRHDGGRLVRRSIGIALGTTVFSSLALVCMSIRSDEIGSPLFWLPPVLALASSVAVALGLLAIRPPATQ
ncbi:hypothetical protein [Aeromicrobium endophyticum]|uniref:Uncharacterized protein n=1 Tax=Aeromicrobium endophyticum TaxID=2292704 RepID=A0A371P8I0_9ACTN|nr:hypothetical protein [Aeromicrobium endophyticum]REK72231.1 hypothetical protein DX116_00865 [Aeromicrobium endophyticum]